MSLRCYNPDGSTAASDQIPCASVSPNGHTHCCQRGATCISNGLCFVSWDNSLNTGTCTDSSWNAQQCFQDCVARQSQRINSLSAVYKCTDNNFCCSDGGNTTNCCTDAPVGDDFFFKVSALGLVENGTGFVDGYTIAPNSLVNAAATSSFPSSTSSAATATSQSTQQTDNCRSSDAQSSSSSRTCTPDPTSVGVGVGVGVGVPLLALALLFSVLWLQERRQRNSMTRNPPPPQTYWINAPRQGVTEVDAARQAIYEIGASHPASSEPSQQGGKKGSAPSSKKSWFRSTRS